MRDFTYSEYRQLLVLLRECGFVIRGYDDCDPVSHRSEVKVAILRHDVDLCPLKALEMAKIEAEQQVYSTYFFLLSTDFYNVFSKKTSRILQAIADLGHDIGLHFDEQRYTDSSTESIQKNVQREALLLTEAVGQPVRVVSMHRPSLRFLDMNIRFEGIINSYSERYFQQMKYVSDSRMHWREDVIALIREGRHSAMHILVHPFWYSDEPEDMKTKLKMFLARAPFERYDNLNDNFRDLHSVIAREELLRNGRNGEPVCNEFP